MGSQSQIPVAHNEVGTNFFHECERGRHYLERCLLIFNECSMEMPQLHNLPDAGKDGGAGAFGAGVARGSVEGATCAASGCAAGGDLRQARTYASDGPGLGFGLSEEIHTELLGPRGTVTGKDQVGPCALFDYPDGL